MTKKPQRWFSFSLKSLLAIVTLLAVWLARESDRVATQRRVASLVARLCAERRLTSYDPIAFSGLAYDYQWRTNGNTTTYDPTAKLKVPKWLRNIVGDDYCCRVTAIDLSDTNVTDSDLVDLRRLPSLETLRLYRTEISEERVEQLRKALPNCHIDWSSSNMGSPHGLFGSNFDSLPTGAGIE